MNKQKLTNTARWTALQILNAVDGSQSSLDQLLAEYDSKPEALTGRDRALATAIIFGVLRWRARLDYIIGRLSKTPLHKIDPQIRNILRIGLFQILYLDRVPVSAAVNTAVDMAKVIAPPFISRFVNGILRNACRMSHDLPAPFAADDPVGALSIEKSFPKWLLKRWRGRFGLQETIALCDSINTIPPITLRTNALRCNREALMDDLSSFAADIAATYYSPVGIAMHGMHQAVTEIPAFKAGYFQVQDEAAQIATYLLDPRPGHSVLDACAGLGGKTGHIAQLMNNNGTLVAMDQHGEKLEKLNTEMDRLGIHIVATKKADLLKHTLDADNGRFDRILLDAPCSGLGVLRRNPDAKWSAAKQMLSRYAKTQLALLTRVAPLVKTGGIVVYTVCSNEIEENGDVIEAFLEKHPQFSRIPPPSDFPPAASRLLNDKGDLLTLPHRHHMDGFFGVRLRRNDH